MLIRRSDVLSANGRQTPASGTHAPQANGECFRTGVFFWKTYSSTTIFHYAFRNVIANPNEQHKNESREVNEVHPLRADAGWRAILAKQSKSLREEWFTCAQRRHGGHGTVGVTPF